MFFLGGENAHDVRGPFFLLHVFCCYPVVLFQNVDWQEQVRQQVHTLTQKHQANLEYLEVDCSAGFTSYKAHGWSTYPPKPRVPPPEIRVSFSA